MPSWRELCRDFGLSAFSALVFILPLWILQPVYQETSVPTFSDETVTLGVRTLLLQFLPVQTAAVIGETDIPTIGRDGIVRWTNVARITSASHLAPLNPSPILDAIAEKRLSDMQTEHYFGHVSPGKYGAQDMSSYFRYRYLLFGENIAAGEFADDQALVKAWMKSPEHRKNILYPRYHEIGIAVGQVTFNGSNRWVAVQLFGLAVADCPHVDTTLPDIITAETVHELQMEHAAANLSAQLKHHPQKTPADLAEFNALVAQYNDLYAKIQYRVALINQVTATYNAQVKAFNTCA